MDRILQHRVVMVSWIKRKSDCTRWSKSTSDTFADAWRRLDRFVKKRKSKEGLKSPGAKDTPSVFVGWTVYPDNLRESEGPARKRLQFLASRLRTEKGFRNQTGNVRIVSGNLKPARNKDKTIFFMFFG